MEFRRVLFRSAQQVLYTLVTPRMQDHMPQFVRQGEAPERLRQVAAEPDEVLVFVGIDEAVGALMVIFGIEGCDMQAKPGHDLIERSLLVAPLRALLLEMSQEQARGCLCCYAHAMVHKTTLSEMVSPVIDRCDHHSTPVLLPQARLRRAVNKLYIIKMCFTHFY